MRQSGETDTDIAFGETQVVKKFNGHSGCEVELRKSTSGYFVRKTAPAQSYAQRLIRQAEKQARLEALIPVPKILHTYFESTPVTYHMEFIQGMDFKQTCLSRPIVWITNFVERIFVHLEMLKAAKVDAELSPLFRQKVASLQDVLANNEAPNVRALNSKLEALYAYDYSGIPATECHGDMTLENIIFKSSGEIVFIDVLDGDLESFWMDLAKLVYDVEISWSLRSSLWHPNHSHEERLLTMISRYLAEELHLAIEHHFPEAIPHLPALRAIQALRVLPYSHNEQTVDRLVNYVNRLPI